MTARITEKGLYAITDPDLLPGGKLVAGVQAALTGGARLVQYRNKQASETERLAEARSLLSLTREHNARLIINDDEALCRRIGADGIHLGKSDGDKAGARNRLGDEKIIGVTCHDDLAYAQTAVQKWQVDYCAFGRLFPSRTKPQAPHCPLTVIAEANKRGIPSVAIGGINLENAASVIEAGATMLAVIHGLFGQDDIQATAEKFSSLFN